MYENDYILYLRKNPERQKLSSSEVRQFSKDKGFFIAVTELPNFRAAELLPLLLTRFSLFYSITEQ